MNLNWNNIIEAVIAACLGAIIFYSRKLAIKNKSLLIRRLYSATFVIAAIIPVAGIIYNFFYTPFNKQYVFVIACWVSLFFFNIIMLKLRNTQELIINTVRNLILDFMVADLRTAIRNRREELEQQDAELKKEMEQFELLPIERQRELIERIKIRISNEVQAAENIKKEKDEKKRRNEDDYESTGS